MDDELLEPCPGEPAGHWERFRQNWGRFNHTKVSPAVLERILLNKNTYLLLKNCKRNLCGKRQRRKLTEFTDIFGLNIILVLSVKFQPIFTTFTKFFYLPGLPEPVIPETNKMSHSQTTRACTWSSLYAGVGTTGLTKG